jgi:DNA polymerase-3 subunit beta
MKITILKENFKKGLEIIEKIIGRNLTLPILNNILISTEENLLKLSGTDLEIGINYWALCKVEKQGGITIPAKFLYSFVNSLPEEKIELEVKNKILYIECKNYKTQIKGDSIEDFPIIPKIETESFIEINSAPFAKGISQVVDFTTLNQTKPEFSGIYFDFQKNKLSLASTDSFRLAEKNLYFEKEIKENHSFILPQKTAHTIMNIFTQKNDKMKIYFTSNQVLFEAPFLEIEKPKIQIISRLIEGKYPNYQEIIPKEYKTEIVLLRDEFINQIKTASLFTGNTNEIKVNVNQKQGEIKISSQNTELGENQSNLKAKIKGEDVEISFNWKYLLDGLTHLESQEVIIGLSGEEGPAVLKPKGDENYLYVVMPIKGI